jgi:hypothetical protein
MSLTTESDCSACCQPTEARAPNKAFLALIAAFWVASLALGFVAAQGHGWDLVVLFSWAAVASSVVFMARRATTWTCVVCGSSVSPPNGAALASTRSVQVRHA